MSLRKIGFHSYIVGIVGLVTKACHFMLNVDQYLALAFSIVCYIYILSILFHQEAEEL